MEEVTTTRTSPPMVLIAGLLLVLLVEVGTALLAYKGYLSLLKNVLVLVVVVLVLKRIQWAVSLLALWLIAGSCLLLFVVLNRGIYALLPLPIFYAAFGLYLRMSNAVKLYLSSRLDQSHTENNYV
jgi:uncharacterized membrane protein YvlD (DUF360 family)